MAKNQTKVTLRNGREVLIRPIRRDDLEPLYEFFQRLTKKDRRFLRYDVSRRDIAEERFRASRSGRAKRRVAIIDDRIAASGVLEMDEHGWKGHVGELRLIVARPFQRQGLGMLMARELYRLAASLDVEEIVVKMMRPQLGARKIFRRLGFRDEIVLPEYVRDLDGTRQDLVIMRCDLDAAWRELEDYFTHGDWQRTR